jgi:hypothetical protein
MISEASQYRVGADPATTKVKTILGGKGLKNNVLEQSFLEGL